MFFLWIILIFILIIVAFYTLSLKLEFNNFAISFPNPSKINKNTITNSNGNDSRKTGMIKLKVYIFNLVKIVDYDLKRIKKDKIKVEQIKNVLKMIKQKRNSTQLKIKEVIKGLNLDIQKYNLEITVGIKDAATTAITVGILHAILENILIDKSKKKLNQNYLIIPNYEKEIILIRFDGIFNIKMRDIINTLYKQLKRRVKRHDRTSDRKFNVFSNE